MFLVYSTLIAAGVIYFTVIGLTHN